MSIHIGFAARRNFLRSATASQVHVNSIVSGMPQPIVVGSARELRTRVDAALLAGELHLVVDCDARRDSDVSLLSALLQCAHRGRERGARVEFLNLTGELRASVRDLRLEERLGLA